MLNYKLPVERRNLLVNRRHLEITLVEDSASPLVLVLPPLEEIYEMHSLRNANYSLRDVALRVWGELEGRFERELEILERKRERFGGSATFQTRMADFAELSGDRVREAAYLEEAYRISLAPFFKQRLGENLVARQEFEDAERLFSSNELKQDIHANLRLAYFRLQKQDLPGAARHVANALEIDPFSFSARLFDGALHIIGGGYDQAIKSFRIAVGERSNSSAAYTNLAFAYVFSKKTEKAFAALRTAVALDPLNENAITFLADLSYAENRNQDAVPSLRCYLGFEQKNAAIWGRLARALLEIGEIGESIAALRRQGSIEDTCAVWNNLGVAYHRKRDTRKAYESFKHAMQKGVDAKPADYFLAARNIAALLFDDRETSRLLDFTKSILAEDNEGIVVHDRHLSDIIVYHLLALAFNRKFTEMLDQANDVMSNRGAAPNLLAWVAGSTIGYYALMPGQTDKALALAERFSGLLGNLGPQDEQRRRALANNIMFAYTEVGRLADARSYLPLLSNVIHVEPYPTATLGLFHMRKGDIQRGVSLYEEAVGLSNSAIDKNRIRQKLNFELGKHFLLTDPIKAKRYFEKVAKEQNGSPLLEDSGKAELKRLQNKDN